MLKKNSQMRFHGGSHQSLDFNGYFTDFAILIAILCSSMPSRLLSLWFFYHEKQIIVQEDISQAQAPSREI
jgi:hypothetical protein